MNYKINFINSSYRRLYKERKKEIDKAIQRCYEKGDFILREQLGKFERNFAKYVGSKYCVGVNSGTDALFLSLKALGVKEGDEVITVSHTFIASLQVIVHCGAKPILIDVKEDGLMNPDLIKSAISKKTVGIMPIHLSGKVCDMDKIMAIAKKHKLWVIEDACQALGTKYNGKMAGTFGITGCFSFICAKLLGAGGDGGGIVTDDKKIFKKLLLLRNHWNIKQTSLLGVDIKQPKVMDWGWNSRLDNIHAAVLNIRLKYLNQKLDRRKEIAMKYNEAFKDLPIKLPVQQKDQVYQEYILVVPDLLAFKKHMDKWGIELLIRDITPNYKLKGLGLDNFYLPITDKLAVGSGRLPIYPELTNKEVDYIIKAVKLFYVKK